MIQISLRLIQISLRFWTQLLTSVKTPCISLDVNVHRCMKYLNTAIPLSKVNNIAILVCKNLQGTENCFRSCIFFPLKGDNMKCHIELQLSNIKYLDFSSTEQKKWKSSGLLTDGKLLKNHKFHEFNQHMRQHYVNNEQDQQGQKTQK